MVGISDASDVEDVERVEETDDAEKENRGPRSGDSKHSRRLLLRERVQRRNRRAGLDDDDDESRVPDTEEEEGDRDDTPVVRKRRRVGFASSGEQTKRRRTLGEEHRMSTMKEGKSSRRRTLGDSPLAGPSKSRYHTQTITQLIGRNASFIADSDDEELGGSTQNDGNMQHDPFLEWLGDAEDPQSPSIGVQASKRDAMAIAAAAAAATEVDEEHSPSPHRRTRRKATAQPEAPSREESVVPQTPVKSIRFDLPPSAQHGSPSPSRIAAVYGAPNQYMSPSSRRQSQKSPLKPIDELTGVPTKSMSPAKKPALVIEDSYATEGWSSVGGTQARHSEPSQTQTEVFSTPAEEMANTAGPSTQKNAATEEKGKAVPLATQSQDGQTEEFFGALSQVRDSAAASQQPLPATPSKAATQTQIDKREIPDSDEEDSGFDADSDVDEDQGGDESKFAAGAETQLLMDQLQSSVRKWSATPKSKHARSSSVASPHHLRTSSPVPSPASAITPFSVPPSSAKPADKPPSAHQQNKQPGTVANDIPIANHGPPLRRPLHHPDPLDTQGMPLESQRVAVATLHGFPAASARTDILLPLSRGTLANLVSGHQDAVVLPFKVPTQVVRFWLIHDGLLRYLACVASPEESTTHDPKQDNGRGGFGTWTFRIGQVYELNNPVLEEDMRAEDWIHGQVARYAYLPPAVVSQLLWNLRHPLFRDPSDEDIPTPTTAAAAAATTSTLSSSPQHHHSSSKTSTPATTRRRGAPPSSPLYARPPPSTMPAPPPPSRPSRANRNHTQPIVRPSQATTASQASTVDVPASSQAATATMPRSGSARHHHGEGSSESLVFADHGGSSIPMSFSVEGLDGLADSQLLTKSQTLPDSLIRDEERMPDEIWDSEDEQDE